MKALTLIKIIGLMALILAPTLYILESGFRRTVISGLQKEPREFDRVVVNPNGFTTYHERISHRISFTTTSLFHKEEKSCLVRIWCKVRINTRLVEIEDIKVGTVVPFLALGYEEHEGEKLLSSIQYYTE